MALLTVGPGAHASAGERGSRLSRVAASAGPNPLPAAITQQGRAVCLAATLGAGWTPTPTEAVGAVHNRTSCNRPPFLSPGWRSAPLRSAEGADRSRLTPDRDARVRAGWRVPW